MELDEVWVASILQRVQPEPAPAAGCDPRSIFRVPKTLREVHPTAYDPKIISFGPYHRGREHLRAMEKEKWRYLRSFLSFQQGRTVQDLLIKMKELESCVRRCYADAMGDMNSNQFAEMMLLDSCFLVEFIINYRIDGLRVSRVQQQEAVPISISTWRFWLVVNDMMLLENQIPFFVLQEIWNLLADRRVQNGDRLDVCFLRLVKDYSPTNSRTVESDLPSHLRNPYHLLHLFHCYILPERRPEPGHWSPQDTIPCAAELKAAGVEFRKKAGAHVLEVEFSGGVMKMAPLKIYDHTESYLRNLIAFEQCFPAVGNEVSTYAVLMDFLIDTPADAGMLRRSGVLLSGVGNDKNIALFFTNLCRDAFSYRTGKLYTDLRDYCRVSRRKWKAEQKRDYFRSPWSLISFVTAAFLLSLTITIAVMNILNRVKPLSP